MSHEIHCLNLYLRLGLDVDSRTLNSLKKIITELCEIRN